MGPGIAQVFIQNGYDVILHDLTDEILRWAIDRIHLNQKSLIKRDLLSEDGAERARNRLAPQRGFFHPMGCTRNELYRPVIDSANPEIKSFGPICTTTVPSLEDPVLLQDKRGIGGIGRQGRVREFLITT